MPTAKDIMTRDVITVHISASLRQLSSLLAANRITGIPVVDDDKRLVGMISMRDLMVEEIMSRTLHTADESASVRELCGIMNKNKVHRIPILRNGRLVGLVTATDVIRALAEGRDL